MLYFLTDSFCVTQSHRVHRVFLLKLPHREDRGACCTLHRAVRMASVLSTQWGSKIQSLWSLAKQEALCALCASVCV